VQASTQLIPWSKYCNYGQKKRNPSISSLNDAVLLSKDTANQYWTIMMDSHYSQLPNQMIFKDTEQTLRVGRVHGLPRAPGLWRIPELQKQSWENMTWFVGRWSDQIRLPLQGIYILHAKLYCNVREYFKERLGDLHIFNHFVNVKC